MGNRYSPPKSRRSGSRERIEHALDPISKAIPLSPSDVSRTRAWLIQAGLREPRHVSYYFGARLMLAVLGLAGVIAFSGFTSLASGLRARVRVFPFPLLFEAHD